MVLANVVALTDGQDLDLLDGFYKSLLESDFPKNHMLTVIPPSYGLVEGRNLGIEQASQDAEFVLMSDLDSIVPAKWWEPILSVFREDSGVDCVGPMIAYCHPEGTSAHLRGGDICSCLCPQELAIERGRELYYGESRTAEFPELFWDGFFVVRSSSFRESGHDYLKFVYADRTARSVIATKVVVFHQKSERAFRNISERRVFWERDQIVTERTYYKPGDRAVE